MKGALNILVILWIMLAVVHSTPNAEQCINFCDFVYDSWVCTRDDPLEISTTVTLAPLDPTNHLIGVRDSTYPSRYVDVDDEDPDTSRANECLNGIDDSCGVAGKINSPRTKDDHDMVLTFHESTLANSVTFKLYDWGDWNPRHHDFERTDEPNRYKQTRWTLRAYDASNVLLDETSVMKVKKNIYGACKEEGETALTVSAPGLISRVESVFEQRLVPDVEDDATNPWVPGSFDPNIAVGNICWNYNVDEATCESTDLYVPSSYCSGDGYCVVGEVDTDLSGCSCKSGFYGENCEYESDERDRCRDSLLPDVSEFDTILSGDFSNGDVVLSLTAPIQDVTDDVTFPGNFATFTLLYFRNQDQCDYPEGSNTQWEKAFDVNDDCRETYTGTVDLGDLLSCTGRDPTCYDGDTELESCNPDLCESPPCSRCYNAQVQAVRGYHRSTASGRLIDYATAENCHYFRVCLPWIQAVSEEILITRIPEIDNNLVLRRVAFRCFDNLLDDCHDDNSWVVQILSAAEYPWFIQETGPNSGGLANGGNVYDLYSIDFYCNEDTHTDAGCDCSVEGFPCLQMLTFVIPGCDTLETLADYTFVGLEYDCLGDCAAAKEAAGDTSLNGQISLQGANQCEEEFEILATDTITLTLNTYLDDSYEDGNSIFIADDSLLQNVYFLVEAHATLDLSSISVIDVVRNPPVDGVPDYPFTSIPCPAAFDPTTTYCFYGSVADLESSTPLDDYLSVNFGVQVEVTYDEGSLKRTTGLGNEYTVRRSVRVNVPGTTTRDENTSLSLLPLLLSLVIVLLF